MKKVWIWVFVAVLCPMVALAANGGKATDRVKPGSPVSLTARDEAVVGPVAGAPAPRIPRYQGVSPSAGTYTTLEGWWNYQSNGAVEFLEVDSSTGWIHAIMMVAADSSNQSAFRRTAYARSTDGGATWDNFSNINVPSSRSGYPSMGILRGTTLPGAPVIANHIADPNTSEIITSVHVGDTTAAPFGFSQLSDLPDNMADQPIWPMVTGANDGSILVHSSFSDITTGRLNFINRTADYITWGAWQEVPLTNAAGQGYVIFSNKNGKVGSIAMSDINGTPTFADTGVVLAQSTNNGATWGTWQAVFPNPYFQGADTLRTGMSLDAIYNGDEPMIVGDWAPMTPDGGWRYAGSRILFWSPTTGVRTAVPWDSLAYPSTLVSSHRYFLPVSFPSIGMSGSIIVVAFGFQPNNGITDPVSGQYYHELGVVKSTDGGLTWSPPANITNTPYLDERYPSVSTYNESGYLNIVWQECSNSGSYIPGDDEVGKNLARQVFLKASLASLFLDNDITTLSVTAPPGGQGYTPGQTFTPRAVFRNTGIADQTNIGVKFEILAEGNPVPVYTDPQTIATLTATSTQEVIFT
ncbi:MAG: hypothetical protein WB626_00730, partial [Bacteroidota bacterium]